MKRVADGVWQLDGSPAAAANVFFAGGILFDCRTRWAARSIARQLGDQSVSLIALTHAHPDHWGSAAALSRRYRARVAVHEADAGIVAGRDAAGSHLAFRVGKRLWEGRPCAEVTPLREGDRIGDFTVVHVPGHSAGHVAYFRESDRVAVTGDLFSTMDSWTRRMRIAEPPAFLSVDAEQNRRSIRRLLELEPSIVLPGHGPALKDLDEVRKLVRGVGVTWRNERAEPASSPAL